jgi:hypothetical protein
MDWTAQLQTLLEHTWNGGFNLSSEEHEGASWYGASKGVHPNLHPVEKWEKASLANDAFGLSVPWMPVPLTIDQLIDSIFEENQAVAAHANRLTKRKKSPSLIGRFMNYILQG